MARIKAGPVEPTRGVRLARHLARYWPLHPLCVILVFLFLLAANRISRGYAASYGVSEEATRTFKTEILFGWVYASLNACITAAATWYYVRETPRGLAVGDALLVLPAFALGWACAVFSVVATFVMTRPVGVTVG